MLNFNRLCVMHLGFNGFCVFDDFLGISHRVLSAGVKKI